MTDMSRERPWRGVSLGGWLLLEPGPSWQLFQSVQDSEPGHPQCEWELMQRLRRRGAEGLKALRKHRESFVTRRDFQAIQAAGLNAVRVPFGYWLVLGSTRDRSVPATAASKLAARSRLRLKVGPGRSAPPRRPRPRRDPPCASWIVPSLGLRSVGSRCCSTSTEHRAGRVARHLVVASSDLP